MSRLLLFSALNYLFSALCYLKTAFLVANHNREIFSCILLGLENKFLENKSGRMFCVRQVYNLFYKILPTSLGTCKPTFYTFYTSSEVKQYHDALFLPYRPRTDHNFAIQIALIQHSGRSKHPWAFTESGPLKKFPKSPIRLAGSHLTSAKVDCLNQD